MIQLTNLCNAFKLRNNSSEIALLLEETFETLRTLSPNLDLLQQSLDVKDYSIVHATVLYYKANQVSGQSQEFIDILDKISDFINNCCRNQIRNYFKFFLNMVFEVSKKIPLCSDPLKGINVLIAALRKFQKDNCELTPIHNNLVQLAIQCKYFDDIVTILDDDIMELHKSVDAVCYESFYYFGGMVYLAYKNYERAQYFFELCLFNPTNHGNRIIKEAYKKFSLLTILNSDIDRLLEKPLFSARLDRQLKETFKLTYGEFMNAFYVKSYSKVCQVVELHRSIFENDLNYGIVKQCLKWYREKEILKLTKIYVSLSFDELTDLLELEDNRQTEKILFSMISRKIIDAKIDQRNQIVEFFDTYENIDSSTILRKLQEKTDLCMKLQSSIQKLNDKMSLDPLYLKKIVEKEMSNLK